jgi:hypothetical protein
MLLVNCVFTDNGLFFKYNFRELCLKCRIYVRITIIFGKRLNNVSWLSVKLFKLFLFCFFPQQFSHKLKFCVVMIRD